MSRAANLMRLQRIDTEIDAQRAALGEIERALAEDGGLASARAAQAAASARLAAANNELRSLEAEARALDDKVAEVERTLYGGGVSNPKELVDLQEELASIKRRRATLEDSVLAAMVDTEAQEQIEREAQASTARLTASLSAAQSGLAADRARIESVLQRLDIEREAAEAPISPADRAQYAALRQRKRGLAVARLEDGSCGACGVAPSSSRAQAVRHGDELILCGNCERILYAE